MAWDSSAWTACAARARPPCSWLGPSAGRLARPKSVEDAAGTVREPEQRVRPYQGEGLLALPAEGQLELGDARHVRPHHVEGVQTLLRAPTNRLPPDEIARARGPGPPVEVRGDRVQARAVPPDEREGDRPTGTVRDEHAQGPIPKLPPQVFEEGPRNRGSFAVTPVRLRGPSHHLVDHVGHRSRPNLQARFPGRLHLPAARRFQTCPQLLL